MSFKQIEEYIASLPERFDFPLGECAVWHKGQCVARKTYGAAQGGEIYWLFSCTKPITAALTLRLVQDGVLGLDDAVSKYLATRALSKRLRMRACRRATPCAPRAPPSPCATCSP